MPSNADVRSRLRASYDASVAASTGGAASAGSFVGWVADMFTLLGFALSPVYVPNIGGPFGIVASDVVLGLAGLTRVLHMATAGVSRPKLYRQSYLFGVLSIFAVGGVAASIANGLNPIAWPFLRTVIATMGSVLLIATFGGEDWARNRLRLVQAFTVGCTALAFSTLRGPALQGRPFGWSIHPNAMGHSCIMGCMAAVWLWDNARTRFERLVWSGAAVACLYGVMKSGSRGGLLGLGVGVLLYLVLRGNPRVVLATVAAAWFAVLSVGVGLVELPASNPIVRLFNGEETGSGLSNDARRDLLAEDFEIIGESPLWGGGWEDDERIINVHVVYLQGWVGGGAFAAFSIMLVGATMLVLPLLSRPRDLALTCGAAGIAVAWLFTNILVLRDQWLFIAVAFGSAQSVYVLGGRRAQRDGAASELPAPAPAPLLN